MMSSNLKAVISPYKFRTVLANTCGQFRNKLQQDAHEFLMAILDKVVHLEKMCSGSAACELVCRSCQERSPHIESFSCLSIEVMNETRASQWTYPPYLADCVDGAFADEIIRDDWVCKKCGGREAVKSSRMAIAPRIMVLHLKRFQSTENGYQKNKMLVKLPQTFQIAGHYFSIKGRVNHVGDSMNAGHYTADIEIGEGRWMHCNDSKVFRCGMPRECSGDVYLVFCERKDVEKS